PFRGEGCERTDADASDWSRRRGADCRLSACTTVSRKGEADALVRTGSPGPALFSRQRLSVAHLDAFRERSNSLVYSTTSASSEPFARRTWIRERGGAAPASLRMPESDDTIAYPRSRMRSGLNCESLAVS